MGITELYDYYNTEIADPRTNNSFLVGSPGQLCLLIVAYLYVVLKWGPKYMENKKPYSLKWFIYYYNVFQILANAFIVYLVGTGGWTSEYTLGCELVRTTNRPMDAKMILAAKLAFWLKCIDLIETVVYIFRKKNNQISVLHLYHHVSTILVTYMCTKWFPGGMVSMQMLINGSVHILMYTYYFLASQGPKMQNVLNPIKVYITRIQITQFLFLVWHQSQAFSSSCPIPNIIPTVIITNLLLNLGLFLNFYKKNYVKRSKVA